jgi:hypothetical protein
MLPKEPPRAIGRQLATSCVSGNWKEKVSLAKKERKKKQQRQIGPWGYIPQKGKCQNLVAGRVKDKKKNSFAEIERDLRVVNSVVLECLARPTLLWRSYR